MLPGHATIRGNCGGHGVVVVRFVKRYRHRVSGAVGPYRNPWVRSPLVAKTSCAGAEREGCLTPRLAPIEGKAGYQTVCSSVAPSILLPDADDVLQVSWVDSHVRLDLCIHVVDCPRSTTYSTFSEWAWTRDTYWRTRGGCGTNSPKHENGE